MDGCLESVKFCCFFSLFYFYFLCIFFPQISLSPLPFIFLLSVSLSLLAYVEFTFLRRAEIMVHPCC